MVDALSPWICSLVLVMSRGKVTAINNISQLVKYVAKCNLGKVNLESMLASGLWVYVASGRPKQFAGAPHDLYTQSLAHSHSQASFA